MSGSDHELDVDLDVLRSWVEGRLDAASGARVEAWIALDPDRARRAAQMRDVWTATAAGLGSASTTLRFEDLPLTAGETRVDAPSRPVESPSIAERRRRRVAAAAMVLVLGAGALAWSVWNRLGPARRHPTVVQLATIPLPATNATLPADPLASPARVPEALASWTPVEDGRIRWLDSPADAAAISAATGRPVFVYGFIESCPICQGFAAHEFRDADVLAWVDRTVPLAIDLMKLDEAEMEAIMSRRYPLLELQDPQGHVLRTFGGTFGEVDMPTEFENSVKDVSVPDWRAMRAGAASLWQARAAEAKSDWRGAVELYEPWSRRDDLRAWSSDAKEGLGRIGAHLGRTLKDVRERARADETGAMAALQIEVARFQGTRFEPDLRAVLSEWRGTGTFPALQPGR